MLGIFLLAVAQDQIVDAPLPPVSTAWKLIWHDEFDGTKVDSSKWESPEYKRRDAHWTKDAMVLDGQGSMLMRVFSKDGEFYDGCLRTKERFEKAFGYFEARMRLHNSVGHWPAFWLFNNSQGKIGNQGRDGTEIDIMEVPWHDGKVNFALHWDGYGKEHRSNGKQVSVPGLMEGWHRFGLWWSPSGYRFYVDGQEMWRSQDGGVCQVPLYVKLTDEAEKGGWAGDIRKAILPDNTAVDYVRVYDLYDKTTQKPVYPRPKGTIGVID